MRRLIQLGLATVALTGAGCMGESSSSESVGGRSAATTEAGESPASSQLASDTGKRARTGKTIRTADSQFGGVLFSKSNRAIYYFDKESGRTPECYGDCAEAWPPVLTSAKPRAGKGVKASLLGTTKREDGRRQITYDGHPLYFYVGDPVGKVECHNIEEFGGLWLAVQPNGSPVPVS